MILITLDLACESPLTASGDTKLPPGSDNGSSNNDTHVDMSKVSWARERLKNRITFRSKGIPNHTYPTTGKDSSSNNTGFWKIDITEADDTLLKTASTSSTTSGAQDDGSGVREFEIEVEMAADKLITWLSLPETQLAEIEAMNKSICTELLHILSILNPSQADAMSEEGAGMTLPPPFLLSVVPLLP